MQDNKQAQSDQKDPLPEDRNVSKDEPRQEVIITGKKIKNSVMRSLVAGMYKEEGRNEEDLVEMLLLLDQAVEEGMIDDAFLEKIRGNPDYLEEYLKDQQDKEENHEKDGQQDEDDNRDKEEQQDKPE